MAIKASTNLSPNELIAEIKKIEQSIGRSGTKKWSPREIDIDILSYAADVIIQDDLITPHQELLKRPWALIPFAEIYPEYLYPLKGEYYQQTMAAIAANIKKPRLFIQNDKN